VRIDSGSNYFSLQWVSGQNEIYAYQWYSCGNNSGRKILLSLAASTSLQTVEQILYNYSPFVYQNWDIF
jgi:hypothetical protein